MSSTNSPHEGHAPDSPSEVRALPARPNLEFEHKQAKKLLASLRRGDAEALARLHAKLKGRVEEILHALGLELTAVPDAHLCCGSAGTYSILQPELSKSLRAKKLAALESGQPEVIASANIGCIMHLSEGASVKVRHWIELLDSRMVGGPRSPA